MVIPWIAFAVCILAGLFSTACLGVLVLVMWRRIAAFRRMS